MKEQLWEVANRDTDRAIVLFRGPDAVGAPEYGWAILGILESDGDAFTLSDALCVENWEADVTRFITFAHDPACRPDATYTPIGDVSFKSADVMLCYLWEEDETRKEQCRPPLSEARQFMKPE